MKFGILVCILCLFLAGTASAISVNPVIAGRTIQPGAVVSVPVINTAAITFDSSVHGATVWLDGNLVGSDEAHSKTPVTENEVTAGDHTATFKLDGYQDSVMNFHVEAGRSQTMYAQLSPSINMALVRQDIARDVTLQAQRITLHPVTITTTATATPTPAPSTITCPAGYSCMSLAKAREDYGAGNYTQYSSTPCGFDKTAPGAVISEVCIAPAGKTVLRVPIRANIVQQDIGGQEAGKGGGGPNPPIEPLPPVAEAPPAITHIGIIDSFLGNIFGGIFGHSVPKPPLNVTMVGPTIPPGQTFLVDSYTVAPVIDKGATIYIGEERLNVTHALNQARGTTTDAANNAVPALTTIGWWLSPADLFTNSPSKTIDLGVSGRYRSMTVAPADFVGYPGNWYLLGASGYSPYSTDSVVFIVRDPQLDLSVKNAATLASVEGTTVAKGTQLRFSITKNMAVKNPLGIANYRSPLAGTRDDGFLDIVVVTPSGKTLTELGVTTDGGAKTTESLLRSCWDTTLMAPNCNPTYTWDTGATLSNGTAKYPSGTYTVQVISKLNNLKNNYKNGGQLYVGKTVSEKVTFTLA